MAPDGSLSVLAHCEYPNGLALSPDERTLYVANTRSSKYIHAIELDAAGNMIGRRIFADMNEGSEPGIPDGLKVDSIGRVYCTGPGGIWVFAPDGKRVGIIRFPEQAVNFAFGGPDLRTLLLLRPHLGLHPAGQGAGQSAPLVQAARAVRSMLCRGRRMERRRGRKRHELEQIKGSPRAHTRHRVREAPGIYRLAILSAQNWSGMRGDVRSIGLSVSAPSRNHENRRKPS